MSSTETYLVWYEPSLVWYLLHPVNSHSSYLPSAQPLQITQITTYIPKWKHYNFKHCNFTRTVTKFIPSHWSLQARTCHPNAKTLFSGHLQIEHVFHYPDEISLYRNKVSAETSFNACSLASASIPQIQQPKLKITEFFRCQTV